jgi:sulfatase modifying factor 1
MANFDDLKLSVEALSGGKNTVLLDDLGMPSIMVRIPKFYLDDVITGAAHTPHPAFIVNGVEKDEIYISKFQNIVMNGRAYSLPFKDPAAYVNFDQVLSYCYAKGNGWHLMSNAEWAALALWCKKNNFMPRGNNYAGADAGALYEVGKKTYDWILTYNWNNRAFKIDGSNYYHTGRVATGSGPAGWAHDNTNEGIFDLNGNVWEWTSGLRLNDGEIQIMPNNDAAILNKNHAANSPDWKALLQDGSLMAPGTANTLKYDATNADGSGVAKLNTTVVNRGTDATYMYNTYETMGIAGGVTAPTLAKALGLYPLDASHGGDGFWARNNGERLPLRGGYWTDGLASGVFALSMDHSRAISASFVGFRAAFVSL